MSALPQIPAARVGGWMVWLVPVVVLAFIVAWETDWGRQIVRVPSTPAPAEPKPLTPSALPDYQIEGGLAAHSETVQRTLFNATRRPAPALAADDGPRQVARGAFQLMGTTVTGDRNIAFLKEVSNGKTRVVRQGEEINGMKVALVAPDRVQFRAGDDSEELILKVAPGPKTTLAAAPPPPGAPVAAAAAAARQQPPRPQPQQPAALNPAQAQPQPDQPQNARAARRAARAAAMGQGGDAQSGGGGRSGARTR